MSRMVRVLLAVVLAVVVPAPHADAAAGTCGAPQNVIAPEGGWSAARRPVVLVHGWIGGPLTATAKALEDRIGDRISAVTFDYNRYAAHWASQGEVAACLAAFVNAVSAEHGRVDGDGKVVVVAHSMGGLALRYATDPAVVAEPVKAGVLAHVVTLGTPHLGSPLGDTGVAAWKEGQFLKEDPGHVAPEATTSAARCLAPHGQGALLPEGCGVPPSSLPDGVPLTQVAGDITVDRKLFGLTMYSVPISSDGIVPVSSAHGYPSSGLPATIQTRTDACRVDLRDLRLDLGDLDAGDVAVLLAGTVGPVGTAVFDYQVLADLKRGAQTVPVLLLALATVKYAACGHTGLPTDPPALDQVVEAVDSVPTPDPHEVRFDGIGAFGLALTGEDLRARGFASRGNLYGSKTCVAYAKVGSPVTFSVDPANGRVLAVKAGGDRALRTRPGGIHVGSTLADVRAAFRASTIDEQVDHDFGQGSNGVVVTGPDGSIAFGLADASAADYAAGRAAVVFLPGVGLPGHAPTAREDGC